MTPAHDRLSVSVLDRERLPPDLPTEAASGPLSVDTPARINRYWREAN